LDREVLFEVVAEQQTKSGGEYRSIAIERSRKSEVVRQELTDSMTGRKIKRRRQVTQREGERGGIGAAVP